jgi:predicted DNA-binding protein
MKASSERLTITLSPWLRDRLREAAEKQGIPQAQLVRQAINRQVVPQR